jgi:hypothetical protein
VVRFGEDLIIRKNPRTREGENPYQRGSAMPTPKMSAPSGNSPLFWRVTLQGVTRAATDNTFESGPVVAERRGMAVEANHHFLVVWPQ